MENWSWIEVVWTLVAVIGAYFSANNIRDGINDLKALRLIKGEDTPEAKVLKITAWGNIRRDSLREVIQLSFLALGVIVGFIPSSADGPSLIGLIVQGVFILCSVALTVSAVGDHYDRIRIQDLGKEILARESVHSGN